jgi:hypothetical protein
VLVRPTIVGGKCYVGLVVATGTLQGIDVREVLQRCYRGVTEVLQRCQRGVREVSQRC